MTLEMAPGGPGRPELLCVGSPGGLSIHLLDMVTNEILCQGLRSGTGTMGPGLTPFELTGCTRCASTAAKRGYEFVVDDDGERIALPGFRPLSAG